MFVSSTQGAPGCCKRVDSSMPKAKQLCSTILLQFVEDNDPKKGAGHADSEHASSHAEPENEASVQQESKTPSRTQAPPPSSSSPERTSPSKQPLAPAKGNPTGTVAAPISGKAAGAAGPTSAGRPGRTPAVNVEQNMASVAAAQWGGAGKEEMAREERGGGEVADSWDARMNEGELAAGQERMHAGKNETAAVRQPLTIFAVMGTVTVASGAAFMLAKRWVMRASKTSAMCSCTTWPGC